MNLVYKTASSSQGGGWTGFCSWIKAMQNYFYLAAVCDIIVGVAILKQNNLLKPNYLITWNGNWQHIQSKSWQAYSE